MRRTIVSLSIFAFGGLTMAAGGCSSGKIAIGQDGATSDGGNGTGASSRDGAMSCGGSGEPCCDGTACNNGFMCSGGLCSVSGSGPSSSGGDVTNLDAAGGGGVLDSSPTVDASPADYCSGAMVLAPGGTLQGTTCGGVSGHSAPCGNNLVVYVYVDAPDGGAFELSASPGVQLLGYVTCQSELPDECTAGGNSSFEPPPLMRLFGVERYDTNCGQFTVSVTSAPDADPTDAAHSVPAD
jgi:hypothetical protein